MPKRIIVFITDCIDIAGNEIRASLLKSLNYDSDYIIEPLVPVLPAFSMINANFAMRLMADIYPPGTLFLSTVNPLKIRPASLLGRCEKNDFIFIGRNTGVFDWLTRDFGCAELYNLGQKYGSEPSEFISFAGKYITAPIAAQAAKGVPLKELGEQISPDEIVRLHIPDGTIVHIDNFGMMKFTGELETPEEGDSYTITINNHVIKAVFGRRMMSYETGEWVLFPGSSFSLFELGMVRKNGIEEIKVKVGDILNIKKDK